MSKIHLVHGDCLIAMKDIPDHSIDMILCDLPYGTTACKWDTIIPFEPLWGHYWRVLKRNGAVVLFGTEPFSSHLRLSQLKAFRYDWIWHKTQATGFLNAKKQPLREYEVISVFYQNPCTYNPQIVDKEKANIRPSGRGKLPPDVYGKFTHDSPRSIPEDKTYPKNILRFPNCNRKQAGLHPTQKPVPLLEYLIRTYTQEGETVLDNCMGSGSTGVATVNTNRNFIGIEMDEKYYQIAQGRITETQVVFPTR